MALAALLPWMCSVAIGQDITIGAIAGTNITDDVRSGHQTFSNGTPSPESPATTYIVDPGERRPILGFKIEYRLPGNFALEFDALHRELKYTTTTIYSPPFECCDGFKISKFGPSTSTLATWEFPLLAKYRLPLGRLHPFIAAGPSFRPGGSGTGLSHAGFAAGGGLEFFTRGFRISPTLRYTYWPSANASFFSQPLPNQVEFLVGLDRPSTAAGFGAFGRRLSAGVIAGVGLGQDFRALNSGRVPESNSGIYGVMLEASLPKNLAVEVDGLYRPLHGSDNEFGQSVRFAHLTWEFPVLLKYKFWNDRRWRPVLEAGPSFRAEGNLNLQPVSHFGATVGVGLETKLSKLKITPMVRYTHWGSQTNYLFQPQTWANQTQLLVSFTF